MKACFQNYQQDGDLNLITGDNNRMNPVVGTIWDVGIAVGPVIGYVYQYFLIKKRKSVGTFSINLCGVLLFCNILRIGFFFFKRYSTALLAQSILMIVAQIPLLYICVKAMNQQGIFESQSESNKNRFLKSFWRWKQFSKYLMVIGAFTASVLILSYFFYKLQWNAIGELIGYMSLISQSLLMLPQILENYKQKRVKGLSHFLVFLNFIGDIMKFGYFIVNNQPMQFFVCGVIQIILDFTVIVQIFYYGRLNKDKDSEQIVIGNQGEKPEDKVQGEKVEVQMNNQQQKPPECYNQLDDQVATN